MQRLIRGAEITLIVLVFVVLVLVSKGDADHTLLVNGGMELPYNEQGAGEIKTPYGWTAWWLDGKREIPGITGGGAESNPTGRPEYNAATLDIDPRRVRSGGAAAHWFAFSRTAYAGLAQQVTVERGDAYRLSVWAQCWSGDSSDPTICPPDRTYISLGIDPEGGTWPGSRSVVWTQWAAVGPQYAIFDSLNVTAKSTKITVYVSVAFKWAFRHNDVYVDDALLVLVSQGTQPCPTPNPCPTCPTPAPCIPGSVDYARIKRDTLDALAEWDRR